MIVSSSGGRRILPAFLLWCSSVTIVVLFFLLLESWAWTSRSSLSHQDVGAASASSRRRYQLPVLRLSSLPSTQTGDGSSLDTTTLLPPSPQQRRPSSTKNSSSSASRARRKRADPRSDGRHSRASKNSRSGASSSSPEASAVTRTLPRSIPRLSDLLLKAPPSDAMLEGRGRGHDDANRTAPSFSAFSRRRHPKTATAQDAKVAGTKRPENAELECNPGEPYRAGYYTSCKTQQRIKDAATGSDRATSMTAADRSALVLRTFLDTPPERTNPANLVCALTSSAKVLSPGHRMSDRGLELFFRTADVLDHVMSTNLPLSGRQLCNVAWAIARHLERDPRVLPPPTDRAALSNDRATGVAETWDLAALERAHNSPAQRMDGIVDRVASDIVRNLGRDPASIKVGELSMACWAFGVLRPRNRPPGWKHGPQLASIRRRRAEGEPASGLTLKFESWSSSSIDIDDVCEDLEPPSEVDKFFDAVGRALMGPSSSSNHEEGPTRVTSCQWKELANLAWAFASHGRSCSLDSQRVLTEIARETAARLQQQRDSKKWQLALSRDVSQIVWSLGILQSDNYRLADGLVDVVGALVDCSGVRSGSAATKNSRPFLKWSCEDIVQVVLSLAHARVDEPDLLRHLFMEAALRLERGSADKSQRTSIDSPRVSFHAWEVSILLWSQARLYLKEPQGHIFARFTRVATSYLCEAVDGRDSMTDVGIGAQEQANLAWSLTLLEEHEHADSVRLLGRIFDEAAQTCKREGIIHLEHAHQLWQALFLLEDECPEAVRSVPRWFYDYLKDKWRAEKSRAKVSSARHRALSQTLTAMGIVHKNEHDEDIDVAIVLKPSASWVHETSAADDDDARTALPAGGDSVRVAVEFDGPNHFTRPREAASPGDKPEVPRALGHTVLKYRLLKKQGWIVVRVPYYEFDRIPFWASMERQRYLQRLLKTHGNLHFSRVDVSEYKPQVPNRLSRFD